MAAVLLTGCGFETDREIGARNRVPPSTPATSAPASTSAAPETSSPRTSTPETSTPAITTAPPETSTSSAAPTPTPQIVPAQPETAQPPAPVVPDEVLVIPNYDAANSINECTANGDGPHTVPVRNTPFCDGYILNFAEGNGGLAGPQAAYGGYAGQAALALCKVFGQNNSDGTPTEWTVIRTDPSWAEATYAGASQVYVGYVPTSVVNPGNIDSCRGYEENPAASPLAS